MANFPISLPISVADAGATKQLHKIAGSMDRLTKSTTRMSGAFQNAFQFYVRFRIFGLINRAISSIENLIPGLIARGREWASTVDEIADSTGMAAEQASLFAGMALQMTGNVDGLTKALGALAQQVTNHNDILKRYGIQTKDVNGNLLDTWTILQNVRKALADTGNSFLTTAAARDLFSRGGQVMLDLLTMTDKSFKVLVKDIRESGSVMSKQGLQTADQFERTMNRLQVTVNGVANQLMEAIGPNLMRFVDAISNFIRANLTEIVTFLAQVTSAVVHFTAGFLGIDMAEEAFAETQDKAGKSSDKLTARMARAQTRVEQRQKAEEALTAGIKSNIDAIDKQLAAMGRQDQAEDARRKQRELLKDISDAKRELNELRGKGIFAAGMSNTEAELARQAQAADIIDAQKRIADARDQLAEHNRKTVMDERRFELEQRKAGLQDQLAARLKSLAKVLDPETNAQNLGDSMFSDKNMKAVRAAALAGWKEMKPGLTAAGENFRLVFDGIVGKLEPLVTSIMVEFPSWLDTLSGIGTTLSDIFDKAQEILDEIFGEDSFFGQFVGKGKPIDLSPADTVIAAVIAWKAKGLVMRGIGGLAGAGLAGAGAAGAGAGLGGLARVLSPLAKVLGPIGAVLSAKEVIDQVNTNSKMFEEIKSGNLARLGEFLKSASSEELQTATASLKALPGNLGWIEGGVFSLSSGVWGLDTLFGNMKEHNETVVSRIDSELESRAKEQARIKESMSGVASKLTAGGATAGSLLSAIAGYTHATANRASTPINATINMNFANYDLVATGSTGNSSIRPGRHGQ